MKLSLFLSLLLIFLFGVDAQAQLTPYFTGQVITTKAVDATHLQIRFKSEHGYTFSDITSGDILAVKSGSNIVRYTIDATSTAGFHPNLDGTLTLSPLDGYTGAIPVGKPTLPTVIYRESNGVAPLDYLSQDWLNWNLLNHELIGLGSTVVVDATDVPLSPDIDFGGVVTTSVQEGLEAIDARLDTAMAGDGIISALPLANVTIAAVSHDLRITGLDTLQLDGTLKKEAFTNGDLHTNSNMEFVETDESNSFQWTGDNAAMSGWGTGIGPVPTYTLFRGRGTRLAPLSIASGDDMGHIIARGCSPTGLSPAGRLGAWQTAFRSPRTRRCTSTMPQVAP